MSALTTYDVADTASRCCARPARGAQRDQHARCSRSCSPTSASARADDEASASSCSPRPTTWASRPAPTSARSSTRRARSAGCSCSRALYDELDRVPEADGRRLPRRLRRRRRRDRGRLRPAGRRLEPAAALPRRRRSASRSGPARLVTLCGLSVAKYLLLTSKEVDADDGLPLGPRPQGRRRRRAPRRRRCSSPRRSPSTRPRRSRRLKRMLHEWDDVEEPLAGRGRGPGRVAALRPGLAVSRIAGAQVPTRHARTRSGGRGRSCSTGSARRVRR